MASPAIATPRLNRIVDYKISLFIGMIALLLGAFGVVRVLFFKEHGALTSYVPWGLWVGVYVFLVWLEVGMIITYFLLRRFMRIEGLRLLAPVAMLAAISALTGALFVIGMDLGHPFRFWKAYLQPNFGSLMSWMIWLHTIYLFILTAELYAYFRGRKYIDRWHIYLNFLTYISIPIGVLLIAVIGGLFGVVAARPFWNASVLPLMFFIASLVAGMGLLTILHLLFSPTRGTPEYEATAIDMARVFMGAIIVGMIASLANGLVIAYPNVPAYADGLRLVLFGPYWWTIWIVHLGIGVLVPLILLGLWRRRLWAIGTASACYLVGFTMVPVNIIIPGLAYPMPTMEGIKESFSHPKLLFDYAPALMEWQVVVFAIGISLLVFTVGYRFIVEPYLREHH